MAIEKYLYLDKFEYATTWINGGEIPPPSLASSYIDTQRSGTKTPDETHIILGDDPSVFKGMGISLNDRPLGSIIVSDCVVDDRPVNAHWWHRVEDAFILSFSNSFDLNIGTMLGKSVCIKILDMEKLKKHLDKQMNIQSTMRKCEYIQEHTRDHFTKNIADQWQDEYRILWNMFKIQKLQIPIGGKLKVATKPKPLLIPKGIAELVSTIPPLPRLALCPCSSGRRFKHCHGQK